MKEATCPCVNTVHTPGTLVLFTSDCSDEVWVSWVTVREDVIALLLGISHTAAANNCVSLLYHTVYPCLFYILISDQSLPKISSLDCNRSFSCIANEDLYPCVLVSAGVELTFITVAVVGLCFWTRGCVVPGCWLELNHNTMQLLLGDWFLLKRHYFEILCC